jgi:hypothetical protein
MGITLEGKEGARKGEDTMKLSELWVLDRIEDGKHAVLLFETGEERKVVLGQLPDDVREGDALRELPDGRRPKYVVDRAATAKLRRQVEEVRASLRRGPSGPMSL